MDDLSYIWAQTMSSSGVSLGLVSLIIASLSWVPWFQLFEVSRVDTDIPLPPPAGIGSTLVEHKISCACDCGERLTLRVAIGLGSLVIFVTTLLNIAIHCCLRPRRVSTNLGKGKKGQLLSIRDGI